MTVQHILRIKGGSQVMTVTPDQTVAEAAQILASRRIGALVVSEDGQRVQGILSERDIVRGLGQRGAAVLSERVSDVMTPKIVTCAISDTAELVMQRMTDGRFRHMPVMDGEIMIGLISIGDVVKARLGELDAEREALTGMIMGN